MFGVQESKWANRSWWIRLVRRPPISFHLDLSRQVQIIRLSSLSLTDTNFMLQIVDCRLWCYFYHGGKKEGGKKRFFRYNEYVNILYQIRYKTTCEFYFFLPEMTWLVYMRIRKVVVVVIIIIWEIYIGIFFGTCFEYY
jgi:hypothetical protein